MIKIDNDFNIEDWYDKEIEFEDLDILESYESSHSPKIPISIEIRHTDKTCYYILRKRIE